MSLNQLDLITSACYFLIINKLRHYFQYIYTKIVTTHLMFIVSHEIIVYIFLFAHCLGFHVVFFSFLTFSYLYETLIQITNISLLRGRSS